jgi:hypothetical protein
VTAPRLSSLDVMRAPELLGPHLGGDSFRAWHTFVAAVHALPPPYPDSLAVFQQCTGRTRWPTRPALEVVGIKGRRSGKTNVAGGLALCRCVFQTYALPPGTDPVFACISVNRKQARVLLRYVRGLIRAVPVLEAQVESETADSISFRTGVRLEVHTASFRSIRGYTLVGAVVDELAFFRSDDSANPDSEILEALRPAMATIPDAQLVLLSSPYAKRGELYRLYDQHWGKEEDASGVLVWKAPTRLMNPTVPQRVIDLALARDEASARAEYLAEFRSDLEQYISREIVDACTDVDVVSRPYDPRRTYQAFIDPAGGGGSGQDAMTLAIGHSEVEGGRTRQVLDVVIEVKPPFSPDEIVDRFVGVLREYHVTSVTGDRWGGEWVRSVLTRRAIRYVIAEQAKSELYTGLLPLLTSGRVRLLDLDRLALQLTALERRTSAGGRDRIDHPAGAHDDVANAVAGVLVALEQRAPRFLAAAVWSEAFA